MGIDGPSLRFPLAAPPQLDRTLTIGRQALIAPRDELEALVRIHGLQAPATADGFAEPNQPLDEPPSRFTAVIDAGALEHTSCFMPAGPRKSRSPT